jgi:VIT1/CCC1 family predicted Fe2+/Mn2+ transporter
MSWDQIAKRWRTHLVNKLQERYGLAEEEARKKAEMWLQWLKKQPRTLVALEIREERSQSRLRSRIRPGKSRARAAASL